MSETCACGDVFDEHYEDNGKVGKCQVEGCPCIYFDAEEDDDA